MLEFARSRKFYNCRNIGILGILLCVSFYYNHAALFLIENVR